MKASELRIGNLLHNQIFQSDVTVKGIVYYQAEDLHRINVGFSVIELITLFPIPLTEEWILKFGFGKIIVSKYATDYKLGKFKLREKHGFGKFFISVWNNEELLDDDSIIDDMLLVYADYVHQLQNLYFALTGEELKLQTIEVPENGSTYYKGDLNV